MWKEGLFLDLIREAEQCDRQLPNSLGVMTSEKETKIFSDLIRSTTRQIKRSGKIHH